MPVGARRRQLDHVRPVFRGGRSELANTVLTCSIYNSAKSALLYVVLMPLTELVDMTRAERRNAHACTGPGALGTCPASSCGRGPRLGSGSTPRPSAD